MCKSKKLSPQLITITLFIVFTLFIVSLTTPPYTLAADMAYENFKSGVSYFDKGDYKKAESAFQQALKERPNLLESHYNLGVIYDIQERFSEAIEAYKKVVAINPNLGKVLENLARDSYLVGNLKEAAYYAQLAEKNGKYLDKTLYDQIFSDSARKTITGGIAPISGPETERIKEDKERLVEEIRKIEERIAQRGKPSSKDRLYLARAYRQTGEIQKAINLLTKAIEEDKSDYRLQAEIALCYYLQGQREGFLEHFKMAKKLGYTPSVSLLDLYSISRLKD